MIQIRPPLVAGLLVGAAFGLDALQPAPRWLAPPWTWFGVVPIALGVVVAGWAVLLFRRGATTHHPFRDASALVVSGPYRFTRNPMYLGVTSILIGVAMLSGSLWLVAPPLAFAAWIDRLQIPGEERALARLFGAEYDAYRARVRRWL